MGCSQERFSRKCRVLYYSVSCFSGADFRGHLSITLSAHGCYRFVTQVLPEAPSIQTTAVRADREHVTPNR